MSDYEGARLRARRQWDSAIWFLRGAEQRHGVGSVEWMHAAQMEKKAQDEYHTAARLHQANCPLHRSL